MKEDNMRITVNIKEGNHEVGLEVTVEEGCLSEVARVVDLAVSAAFEYPVKCVLVTPDASFDADGFVG
jgi:hypothetical protein